MRLENYIKQVADLGKGGWREAKHEDEESMGVIDVSLEETQ